MKWTQGAEAMEAMETTKREGRRDEIDGQFLSVEIAKGGVGLNAAKSLEQNLAPP